MVTERVGRLKSLSGEKRRSSMVQGLDAAGKPGQAAKLSEAEVKQGARRQTWMGPAWLGSPADSDLVRLLYDITRGVLRVASAVGEQCIRANCNVVKMTGNT